MTTIRPSGPEQILLPREVVLASAGTGKTFTLSSRMLGLLALGFAPQSLLATTFTRKAAGEILNRLLLRLARAALGDAEEVAMARAALFSPPPDSEGTESEELFPNLLRSLVRDLHRVNVGTLDSLFIRIAKSFSSDLGMPPDWSISDDPTALRLESEALQTVLSLADPREMIELVRMTMRGESGRGLHGRVLEQLSELRELLHQRGVRDPEALWEPPLPGLGTGMLGEEGVESVIRELENSPLPTTSRGDPDRRFQKAVAAGIQALEAGDWEGFCGKGLGKPILGGETTFSGRDIPGPLLEVIQRALGAAAAALAPELKKQSQALRSLVLAFDEALSKLHRSEGAYRFQDITFLLGSVDSLVQRGDLWYRLDQRTHHLLLDEFQDTSRAQWAALEPLATELMAGDREERSVVLVADPKQSIYGWRGGEPELVHRVKERYGLDEKTLDFSYRSAKPVLDFVNTVFADLPWNSVWERRPDLERGVEGWASGFRPHEPARDLPGYVSLQAGPREERMDRSDRPRLMAWAAKKIRDLHLDMPGKTVGVLVRRNASVSRLMAELRALKVDASEEGSSTLTDSPAVSTFLALITMVDHPGDEISRYQVARSPLGEVLGLTTHQDRVLARELARRVRRDLLTHGYGPVLNGWVRDLAKRGALGARDVGRLLQLVELGHRWDGSPTLRPQDFVRFVRHQSMEAPSSALVRVMNVHQAKGLEFDAVVLPELDGPMTRGQGHHGAVLPLRDPQTGEVVRIFPRLSKVLRPLFPDLATAGIQDLQKEIHDAIGILYVALTRARQGLYLLTAEDPADGPARKPPFTYISLIRGGLGLMESPIRMGETPFELGDPAWARSLASGPTQVGPTLEDAPVPQGSSADVGDGEPPLLRLRPAAPGGRTRLLPHRTPSSLEGLGPVNLKRVLSLSGDSARTAGTVVHQWLEGLEWMEDWKATTDGLRNQALALFPWIPSQELDSLARKLHEWLHQPEIRNRLSRSAYPEGARVRTEVPFALRLDQSVYQGRMDRVVLIEDAQGVYAAEVLDFKTDATSSGGEGGLTNAAEAYRGQVEIYRQALARLSGLPVERVTATLVYLAHGRVVEIHSEQEAAGS